MEFDRDNGKRRVRFRNGGISAYLTGTPWSDDFMREYAAALDGVKAASSEIGAKRTAPHTLGALIKTYLDPASTSLFKTRRPETQRTQRNILENFAAEHGTKPLYRTDSRGRTMLLEPEHLQVIVNSKATTPFAQRNFLNTVRVMFKWAKGEGRIPADPTLGVTREKVKTTGYRSWSEEHIERFEATHAIGTKGRLAFGFLLYTGQRRSDVVRMGPQHVHRDADGEFLILDQVKTAGTDEAHVEIPVHPNLRYHRRHPDGRRQGLRGDTQGRALHRAGLR